MSAKQVEARARLREELRGMYEALAEMRRARDRAIYCYTHCDAL